jgi:glycosyltransferase involved in cell wall biosynthesis
MRILLLAPEPFYEDRGTPIAVNLLLRVLSERHEEVDLLTYHRGRAVAHDNVAIHRIPAIPFIKYIPPGLSLQKLVCDVFLFAKAIQLAARHRYDLVHAVEESVFMAMWLKRLFGIPYVYDMDSSLPQQIVEKHPRLAPLSSLLAGFEGRAVRGCEAVVPVCQPLATLAEGYGPRKLCVVRDVSLLTATGAAGPSPPSRDELFETPVVMYAGNLEHYQGIDLLLESFARAARTAVRGTLVIIGGAEKDILRYQAKAAGLGIAERVRFLGPQPVERLGAHLARADVLVSPRIKGKNTPMKIYSYLHSGKAVLATDIECHRQVLDRTVAAVAPPEVEAFARALALLMGDELLRRRLGNAGRALIEARHTYEVFRNEVNGLYDWLAARVGPAAGSAGDGDRAAAARAG